MSEPRADVLARILLIQNVVGQLPDETGVFAFLCRGLQDVPGISKARFEKEDLSPHTPGPADRRIPLTIAQTRYGEIVLEISNAESYELYAPFIGNLCFMVAVILEERRQRALNTTYQRGLEDKVLERTKQLEEEKSRAELYLKVAEAIIVELDVRGNVSVVNQRACDVLGYSKEEIIGSNFFDLSIPEDLKAQIKALFAAVFSQPTSIIKYHDSEIITRKGERRMIAWHNEVRTNASGEVIGTISSGIDITERKLAEKSLADEKERLAVTLRSIGDGVITTDTSGSVMIMNRVAEQLTGWRSEDALGKPLSQVFNIINETTRLPCENPFERVLSTGLIVELANHTVLISRDGAERPIADSGAPIKDRNSLTVGVVLVFRDMSEKYKLLANAQRTDRLDALGVLAGGIAHDFNNLLAGIFGYVEHAQRISSETSVMLDLEKALSVFNRARDLTQQLLTFSKGGTPIRQVGDIRALLRECSSFALSGTVIALHYDLAADLLPCSFDKNQFAQVIDNIVINAHQAMPDGGSITVRAKNRVISEQRTGGCKPGSYVQIEISDTGTGIPPDKLNRIFDPFFTTKKTGNGLGLATCHSIVQRHDGYIEVESVLGKGTTFRILLPASASDLHGTAETMTRRHKGSGTILVMDDEDFMRDIMALALKASGYDVLLARDGTAALQHWGDAESSQRPIKAIFLDLTIRGGMGGLETVIELRRRGARVPIFATSGYSVDPVMSKPADHDFTASIQKPFTIEELSELLNRFLKS